jgi:hypothetical protein
LFWKRKRTGPDVIDFERIKGASAQERSDAAFRIGKLATEMLPSAKKDWQYREVREVVPHAIALFEGFAGP